MSLPGRKSYQTKKKPHQNIKRISEYSKYFIFYLCETDVIYDQSKNISFNRARSQNANICEWCCTSQ